jgi:uncharacterized membrane protein
MQMTPLPPQDRNSIEGHVLIQRPLGEVFDFYRDFRNLPRFLGDVMAVELKGPTTSRWTIEGPFGIRAHWTVEVTEERENELIRYETTGLPGLRASWEIQFAPGPETAWTDVHEVLNAPLGRIGRAAFALIGKYPAEEVTANLNRLKQLMETGKVSDTSYAVEGKFASPSTAN